MTSFFFKSILWEPITLIHPRGLIYRMIECMNQIQTRSELMQKIRLDPSIYCDLRIAAIDRDDILRLLASLAKTNGIGDEIEHRT